MKREDWGTVARIYREGIEAGQATFEEQTPDWEEFDARRLPKPRLVLEAEGAVKGWAALSAVSQRACYRGVAEFSIYLAKDAQGKGYGTALMEALIRESEAEGFWTLQGTIFPGNRASIALAEKFGFRYVGRRERIAFHRGAWCDTVLYERRSTTVGV